MRGTILQLSIHVATTMTSNVGTQNNKSIKTTTRGRSHLLRFKQEPITRLENETPATTINDIPEMRPVPNARANTKRGHRVTTTV